MTVAELRTALERYPQDISVKVTDAQRPGTRTILALEFRQLVRAEDEHLVIVIHTDH